MDSDENIRRKQGDWVKDKRKFLFPFLSQFPFPSQFPVCPQGLFLQPPPLPPPRLHRHAGYLLFYAPRFIFTKMHELKYTRAPPAFRTVLSPAKCLLSQILFSQSPILKWNTDVRNVFKIKKHTELLSFHGST